MVPAEDYLLSIGVKVNSFGVWIPESERWHAKAIAWSSVKSITCRDDKVLVSGESIICDNPQEVAIALFTVAGHYAE